MTKGIDAHFDSLIPRGLKNQPSIYVELDEYLSRVSNLNSKYLGVKYRKEQWDSTIKEHISSFNEHSKSVAKLEQNLKKGSTLTKSFQYRDIKAENEFEMILYAISSTLSSLTRVISCFLKGNTTLHSHNNLKKVLQETPDIPALASLVQSATDDWTYDLKLRRDSGTHYVALSLKSKLEQKQRGASVLSKSEFCLAIPKKAQRHIPVWEADIPVLGGIRIKTMSIKDNRKEKIKHELCDKDDRLIFRSHLPIEKSFDFIDATEYVNTVFNKLEKYIINVCQLLIKRLA